MPVERGKDTQGPFYRWGKSGKKYYYKANNKKSREVAHNKARRQGVAIKISQSKN